MVTVACTYEGGQPTIEDDSEEPNAKSTILISEGGVLRALKAKRLETLVDENDTCRWVRKGLVELDTLSVNVDNTTYRAEDDGAYGYSQVTVSGISIQRDTDEHGNERVTHTDASGTTTEIVPSSIVIETPPTFTGPYGYRAYIGTEGMVVKAHKNDGTLWTDENHPDGAISEDEYTISPLITDMSESVIKIGPVDGLECEEPLYRMGPGSTIAYTRHVDVAYPERTELNIYTVPFGCYACMWLRNSRNSLEIVFASETVVTGIWEQTNWRGDYTEKTFTVSREVTYNGKTFYSTGPSVSDSLGLSISSGAVSASQNFRYNKIPYLLLYGAILEGGQEVTVQWPRPGDNKALEDVFTVTVENVTPGGGDD